MAHRRVLDAVTCFPDVTSAHRLAAMHALTHLMRRRTAVRVQMIRISNIILLDLAVSSAVINIQIAIKINAQEVFVMNVKTIIFDYIAQYMGDIIA